MKLRRKRRIFRYMSTGASVALGVYFVARVYIYFSFVTPTINILFSFLLLLAEGHSIIQSLGYLSQIRLIHGRKHKRILKKALGASAPGVTILVPGRNEPLEVLELTFISLYSLEYTRKHIVFLDGSDAKYHKANAALSKRYNIEHFVPTKPPASKAEIINMYLPRIATEYLCVFDADQNTMPEFLKELMPIMNASKKIAFVQTPQLYSNYSVSQIAKGAALQQSIFFENICEAKGSSNSMFCCGTNFVMRTDTLREVGGFDESSVTEDFSTSIYMHARGYRSVYYPHVRVFGMAPETLPAYFKQQFRWAAGTIGAAKNMLMLTLKQKVNMNFRQKWEYFLSGTYYLTGWSFFILMLAPVAYLLFGVPTYFASPSFYLLTFLPYYIMTVVTFYMTMKDKNYRVRDVFFGTVMSSLNFPILMKATAAVFLKRKLRFHVTQKGKGGKMPWLALWPWISMLLLLGIAIGFGVVRWQENPYAQGVNIVWCLYHMILLAFILGLNRDPNIKKHSIISFAQLYAEENRRARGST